MTKKRILDLSNPNVAAGQAAKRRSAMPLVARLDKLPQLLTIPVAALDELVIGEYQRREERSEVNDIMHALMAGGSMLDPGTVGRRPDGTRVILDGQQRWWAHKRLARPWQVLVIDVASVEDERTAFNVLNTRREVGANYRINSWPGESAELLRAFNAKPDGPLYQQIDLGGHSSRPLSASILLRVIAAVSGSSSNGWRGAIHMVLRNADWALGNLAGARERASVAVIVASQVFPGESEATRLRYLPAVGLALLCREKWETHGRVISPRPQEIAAMRRIKWNAAKIGVGEHHLPSVLGMLRRRWRSI